MKIYSNSIKQYSMTVKYCFVYSELCFCNVIKMKCDTELTSLTICFGTHVCKFAMM